jgi:hypothetical protein
LGCGFQRDTGVYFTYNGALIGAPVPVRSEAPLFPVVHVVSTSTEVSVNFGTGPFLYTPPDPGASTAADAAELTSSMSAGGFPFIDVDEDEGSAHAAVLSSEVLQPPSSTVPLMDPADPRGSVQPKANHYELPRSFNTMMPCAHVVIGEDEEEEETPTALLIKAWEAQVFPKIRGRFRNNEERKSGLEQIRGALTFGMPEVAIETVNGLFDDNGGPPPDLHFPTVEDLKSSAVKLGVNELQQGMLVQIAASDERGAFEVSEMVPARGLVGSIVEVDKAKSLALVEVYLEAEARLVQWWYPCNVLQRSSSGPSKKKKAPMAQQAMRDHVEFLACHSRLTRLYCRSALLALHQSGAKLADLVSPVELLRLFVYEQLRRPMPGRCTMLNSTVQALFDWPPGAEQEFVSTVNAFLATARDQGSLESFLRATCQPFFASNVLPYCEMPVEPGRGQFTVHFEHASFIFLSLKAKDGSGTKHVIAHPPT